MELRQASIFDASEIAALHIASWREAYRGILSADFLAGPVETERQEVWQKRLSAPPANQRVTMAVDHGELLGFVCAFLDDDPVWGTHVDNLHVAAVAKGRGLGRRLLTSAAVLAAAAPSKPCLYLWVFEANEPARRFYDRMGGLPIERRLKNGPGGTAAALRYHWSDAAALAKS